MFTPAAIEMLCPLHARLLRLLFVLEQQQQQQQHDTGSASGRWMMSLTPAVKHYFSRKAAASRMSIREWSGVDRNIWYYVWKTTSLHILLLLSNPRLITIRSTAKHVPFAISESRSPSIVNSRSALLSTARSL